MYGKTVFNHLSPEFLLFGLKILSEHYQSQYVKVLENIVSCLPKKYVWRSDYYVPFRKV